MIFHYYVNQGGLEGRAKFAGQFAGGIRIGDDVAKVVEVLGEPSRKEEGLYIYDSPEKPSPFRSASFRFKKGKVDSMFAQHRGRLVEKRKE